MAHVCYHTRHRAAERSWKKVIKWSEWPAIIYIGGPNSVILFKISIPLHISSHTWAKFCYTFKISNKISGSALETLDLSLIIISNLWYKMLNSSLSSWLVKLQTTLDWKGTIGKCSKPKKSAYSSMKLGENRRRAAFFSNDFTLKLNKPSIN